ncbi:MAG: hypothetical protein EB060_03340 [Proteobacteria bacterium]|nr:hypothetical protein [Pseudomonadota bacterium]
MIRTLLFLSAVALLSLVAAWMVQNDGMITADWMGYHIEASVAAVSFILLLAVVGLVVAFFALRHTVRAPSRFLQIFRSQNVTEKGLHQLTLTVAALAEGDTKKALACAAKAERLLDDQPLATLFAAEAARRAGYADEAEHKFTELLGHKTTEFLGLKGLLAEATRRGDTKEALVIARKAQQRFPRATGLLPLVIAMYKQGQQWSEMLRALDTLEKPYGFFSRQKRPNHSIHIRKEQALGWLMRGRQLMQEQRKDDAISAFKDAHNLQPEWLPATLALLDAYMEKGHLMQAGRMIRDAWRKTPHTELARRFFRLHDKTPAKKLYKLSEQLVSKNPHHFESHRLLADAALEAEFFKEARTQLKLALEERETTSLCNLMAELEEKEGNREEADRWRKRASNSYMDATWICHACGHHYNAWDYHCSACDETETIEWENSHRILPGSSMKYQAVAKASDKPIWEEV